MAGGQQLGIQLRSLESEERCCFLMPPATPPCRLQMATHGHASDTLRLGLTTSADLLDVRRMHELRCNSYLIKPLKFDAFVELLRSLGTYWFEVVVSPEGSHA